MCALETRGYLARARPALASAGASGPYPERVSKDLSDRARVRFPWRGRCISRADLRCDAMRKIYSRREIARRLRFLCENQCKT